MSEEIIVDGKMVSITYTIMDDAGELLEQIDLPVSYLHGALMGDRLFPAIEAALTGKKVGDVVRVQISPEQGFGPHDPNLTFTDKIDNVPPEFRMIGAEVEMQNDAGEFKTFIVTKIENGKLTVDGNHPLAGKQLTFTVTVTEIRDANDAELKAGIQRPAPSQLH